MKILYISSTDSGIFSKSIYSDLMQKFSENHEVTIAYACSMTDNKDEPQIYDDGIDYIAIKTPNINKNRNLIQKGIATLMFDYLFKKDLSKKIKKQYDLVLYSTPPVNLIRTISFLRQQSPNAFFYLMLKDIFPQNAIDINLMKRNSIIHRFFLAKEKKLYELSDFIGVMSEANRDFILKQYPAIKNKVEICPNTITLEDVEYVLERKNFDLPDDKVLLLYGGNLGLPQSVPFIIECLKQVEQQNNYAVVISGSGAQDNLIKDFIQKEQPKNVYYFNHMPQERYNELTHLCDVGLIFLDYRFTVPNFPQRLLSYLSNSLPVVSATDPNTDISKKVQENNIGYYVPSNDSESWMDAVNKLMDPETRRVMGENGYQFLIDNYTTDKSYSIIIKHVEV